MPPPDQVHGAPQVDSFVFRPPGLQHRIHIDRRIRQAGITQQQGVFGKGQRFVSYQILLFREAIEVLAAAQEQFLSNGSR